MTQHRVSGSPMNFVEFVPRKAHVILCIRLPKTEEYDEQLEESGIETLTYDSQWRQYRLHIDSMLEGKQRETVLSLIRYSRERFKKSI